MRLMEDQVKQGILHPERLVRDAALRYFSQAFSVRSVQLIRRDDPPDDVFRIERQLPLRGD